MTAKLIPDWFHTAHDHDPITTTWLRGLIATANDQDLQPLCWHFEHGDDGIVATGYVTVTRSHQAPDIRRAWAETLNLSRFVDDLGQPSGYAGSTGALTIRIPNEPDPDEACQICGQVVDPRDLPADVYARHGIDLCSACTTAD